MRHLVASLSAVAFLAAAAPAAHASPHSPESLLQALPDGKIAFTKKGGKHWGGKHWKGGRHAKWRGGPPYWAPAHGLRRKRGW
jgi:hypothetical protein